MRNKIVYQSQAKGCGYACVKMALIHYSGRIDFAYASERKVEKQAPSLADLIEYGASFGLKLVAYKVRDSKEFLRNRDFPVLVCVYEKGFYHMLYLYKRKRKSFLAFDPSIGKREISFSSFESMFESKYLRATSYDDISPKFSKPKPFSGLLRFIHCLCSVLPSLFLITSIFFMGSSPLSLPIVLILMSLGLLFYLGSKIETKAMMNRFDKMYINRIDNDSSYTRKENFAHYNAYKASLFSSTPNFLIGIVEILSSLILFSLTNPYSLISLSSSLFFSIVIYLIFEQTKTKYEENVSNLEYDYYYKITSKENRLSLLNKISKNGDKYMSLLMTRQVINIAYIVSISILVTIINGKISIESFFSSAMMNYLMIELSSSCLASFSSIPKRKKEESYFIYHFLEESR